MTNIQRTNVKDWLMIAQASIGILVGLSVILGGMNWIAQVNSNMSMMTLGMTTMNTNIAKVTAEVADLQRWRHEHELEVAPLKERVEKHLERDK